MTFVDMDFQGKKGIWIKLPCELSSLVDIAIKVIKKMLCL